MAKNRGETVVAERPAMSSGVGESRPFIAPEGAFPVDADNPRNLDNCTLNGHPIPEHLRGMIPYEMTDQGHSEKHDGVEHSRSSVVIDEVHQQIRRRGGDLDAGMEPFDAFDPMRELVREYVPDGMHPKFLSGRKVQAEGTTRGYVICRDAHGDPVKLGTSILGYMPEERAARIQQAFEEKSHAAQREIYGEDFDPRNPGRGERANKRVAKQEGDLSSHLSGGSRASFENPGPFGPSPQDSEFGLQGTGGEDFQL